jgi:hypothetical protein
LSSPPPEEILEVIKQWTRNTKFIIKPFENPATHFSFNVMQPKDDKIIAVTVAYPKHGNIIIMGWNWGLGETNIKAYAAINDRDRKESVLRGIKSKCIAKNFFLEIRPPNVDNLEQMIIKDIIPLKELTEIRYWTTLLNLKVIWTFLMSQLEQLNMSMTGFNPSRLYLT